MNLRAIFNLFKETFKEWSEDKAPRLGAALAYYTVFSLAPLLIIVIAITGLVFGREAAQSQIVQQFNGLLGKEGADLIETMITSAQRPSTGIVATVIGIITLIFGALGGFGQLQEAFNTIWEVEPKPGRGIWGVVKGRLFSFTLVLGVAFFLLVSLVLTAALAALGEFISARLSGFEVVVGILNFLLSFGLITLLFALMFKIVPDVEIAWKDVWIGAALTSLLFTLGKFLIGYYLGNKDVGTAYGAAGSLVILLLWIYYSTQILFFGAEFTQVYANQYGSRVVPDEDAMPVTEKTRAQQGIPHEGKPAARPATSTALVPIEQARAAQGQSGLSQTLAEYPRGPNYAAALLSFAAGLSAGVMVAIETVKGKDRTPKKPEKRRGKKR